MSYLDDPRVFFAAERTLLAWIRTGLTLIGIGFMVAKFGLFLRMLAPAAEQFSHKTAWSLAIGVTFVLLGALACLLASLQFGRFSRSLTGAEVPPRWFLSFPIFLGYGLALVGILLALYLVV